MKPNLVALQIAIQAHVPVFLWGGPGIGKSVTVEALAAALQRLIWIVILSIREPSDQGGLPVITPDGVRMEPPLWAKQCHAAGGGIVFFDEFNSAPPTVQSSALRVVHGKWVGDLKLPEPTSFVAAGNPTDVSTGGYDLTSAIANRWMHVDWPVNSSEWADGMIAGWPEAKTVVLPEGWRSRIGAKRANLGTFIRAHADMLYQLPDNPFEQGKAWRSPRSWDMYATLQAAASAIGHNEKSEVGGALLKGCVGTDGAQQFRTWFVNLDLRDAEEYIADPKGVPLPRRQDQVMATLDSVVSAALNREHSDAAQLKRQKAAWSVIARVCEDMPDVAVPSSRTLALNMREEMILELPEEMERLAPVLKAAKINWSGHT
jgi:hypothetical protein